MKPDARRGELGVAVAPAGQGLAGGLAVHVDAQEQRLPGGLREHQRVAEGALPGDARLARPRGQRLGDEGLGRRGRGAEGQLLRRERAVAAGVEGREEAGQVGRVEEPVAVEVEARAQRRQVDRRRDRPAILGGVARGPREPEHQRLVDGERLGRARTGRGRGPFLGRDLEVAARVDAEGDQAARQRAAWPVARLELRAREAHARVAVGAREPQGHVGAGEDPVGVGVEPRAQRERDDAGGVERSLRGAEALREGGPLLGADRSVAVGVAGARQEPVRSIHPLEEPVRSGPDRPGAARDPEGRASAQQQRGVEDQHGPRLRSVRGTERDRRRRIYARVPGAGQPGEPSLARGARSRLGALGGARCARGARGARSAPASDRRHRRPTAS